MDHVGKPCVGQCFRRNLIAVNGNRSTIKGWQRVQVKQIIAVSVGRVQDLIMLNLVRGHAVPGNPVESVVPQRNAENVIFILNFNLVLIFLFFSFSCFRVCISRCACSGFRSCTDLHLFRHLQRILCFKERPHLAADIRIPKIVIYSCQIRNQLIGIMADFIHLIAVLVISRMRGFHVVDLAVQRLLQCNVGIFGLMNIIVSGRISRCHDRPAKSLNNRTGTRYGNRNQAKEQTTDPKHD